MNSKNTNKGGFEKSELKKWMDTVLLMTFPEELRDKIYGLTTVDNPFDPFEQFTSWFMFDEEKGYHTCSYLGRIARTSDQLSEEENELENERAIDEILKYDFRNIYKKVVQKT